MKRLIQSIFTYCKEHFTNIIITIWIFWVTANIILIQMRLNRIQKDIDDIAKSLIIILNFIGANIPLELTNGIPDNAC